MQRAVHGSGMDIEEVGGPGELSKKTIPSSVIQFALSPKSFCIYYSRFCLVAITNSGCVSHYAVVILACRYASTNNKSILWVKSVVNAKVQIQCVHCLEFPACYDKSQVTLAGLLLELLLLTCALTI